MIHETFEISSAIKDALTICHQLQIYKIVAQLCRRDGAQKKVSRRQKRHYEKTHYALEENKKKEEEKQEEDNEKKNRKENETTRDIFYTRRNVIINLNAKVSATDETCPKINYGIHDKTVCRDDTGWNIYACPGNEPRCESYICSDKRTKPDVRTKKEERKRNETYVYYNTAYIYL